MTRLKRLILDIDDDEAGRYAVGRHLLQAGYEVLGAENGIRGLQMAEATRPDLILLDVRLPEIDGFEVCRRIRSNPDLADTAIIQMSASFVDTSSRVKGLENGADAYLTEPVEPPILLATINSLFRMKGAEQKVRYGALQWQVTFDAIQEGVALLDMAGAVVQKNKSFDNLSATPGEGFSELIAGAFERLKSAGQRQSDEGSVGCKTFLITMDPVAGGAGQIEGAVCIVTDITERKSFDQQMRHTAKLESIGVLAGGIAHDFNNLLTGILGNSSLMMETLPSCAPEREMAQEILKASESAADLTRQILAYSGKGRFAMVPVDLSAIVSQTRAFVRRFIPGRVELVHEVMPNPPLIQADAGQMQQLVMNLVINAAESFGEKAAGRIEVRTGVETLDAAFFRHGETPAPGEYVALVVSDSGSGMDEATQSRIFDPFFTTKFIGRGLGLSAVHGILRGHEGLMRLRSKVGSGSIFTLYFPVDKTPRTPLKAPARRSAVRGVGTILVVDDEPTVRSFAKMALEHMGYRVLQADSGETGLDVFREKHSGINLVLLDLTMPLMNGEETYERLRGIDPRVPVILSSGFNHAAEVEQFRAKGIAGFLGKPYTGPQLGEAIEAALENGRASIP